MKTFSVGALTMALLCLVNPPTFHYGVRCTITGWRKGLFGSKVKVCHCGKVTARDFVRTGHITSTVKSREQWIDANQCWAKLSPLFIPRPGAQNMMLMQPRAGRSSNILQHSKDNPSQTFEDICCSLLFFLKCNCISL